MSPQLNLYLDEVEIMDDLRIINKVSGKPIGRKQVAPLPPVDLVSDCKIDDGRLYYDKRWFVYFYYYCICEGNMILLEPRCMKT